MKRDGPPQPNALAGRGIGPLSVPQDAEKRRKTHPHAPTPVPRDKTDTTPLLVQQEPLCKYLTLRVFFKRVGTGLAKWKTWKSTRKMREKYMKSTRKQPGDR
jgi:hypothetical protein